MKKIICHFLFITPESPKHLFILLQIIDLGNGGVSDCLHFNKRERENLGPNFQSLFPSRQKPFLTLFAKSVEK